MSHKTGSMSFVAMQHEISQKELNGEECDRITLFKRTYCNSAGVWANAHAKECYNEMQRLLAESEAE
ncbi:hypothetical protein COCNU_scaffold001479G000030 [Cocos nucifera]|nr:hypothetical protein [Cocos nucifera]